MKGEKLLLVFELHAQYIRLGCECCGLVLEHGVLGSQQGELGGQPVDLGLEGREVRVAHDGLGVGDVGNIVLRDRKHLANDGLIVCVVSISAATGELIAGPDIISRGFVYVRESEELMEGAREVTKEALDKTIARGSADWNALKGAMRTAIGDYMYEKTKRSPMILPVVMEV